MKALKKRKSCYALTKLQQKSLSRPKENFLLLSSDLCHVFGCEEAVVVPAAKKVGADLLDIAAPEIGNILTGKKKFISVAADVGKKTLRKQLGGGKIRKRRIIRRIPPKICQRRRTRRGIFLSYDEY